MDLRDPDELERISLLLTASDLSPTSGPDTAMVTVSDHELRDAATMTTQYWAVVAHQRSDVQDLTTKELRAAARGFAADWRVLGGQARALTLYVPSEYEHDIANALRTELTPAAVVLPLAEIIESVAADPGGLAIVPAMDLALGVLGLVVDGYDSYRDPASTSTLKTRRWVQRALDASISTMDLSAAWATPTEFDPIGLLATGDVVPTRCVGEVLERDGDFNAMLTARET